MDAEALTGIAGAAAIGILAAGAGGIAFSMRWCAHLGVRAAITAVGGALGAAAMYRARSGSIFRAFVVFLPLAPLFLFNLYALVAVFLRYLAAPREKTAGPSVHPLVRKARRAERSLDFAAAVAAYDEYLETHHDPPERARLAEALIKAGNSRRALSTMTVAFSEAEDDKLKIALGIRLAEVILVRAATQRPPGRSSNSFAPSSRAPNTRPTSKSSRGA